MKIPAALLLSVCAASALAQDCVPRFFNSEPRDAEWFYGAGKGADASAARDDALRRLAIKAAGGERVLPPEALAGWEQDDHGECAGTHYALARIEQARVRRNLAGTKIKPDVAPAAVAASTIVNNVSTVNNNVTVTPPEEHHYLLIAIFLGFLVAIVALASHPRTAPYFYKPPGSAGVAIPSSWTLSSKFKAAPRQAQIDAVGEIAKVGLPAYFHAHKGEGTCQAVPGAPEIVKAGVIELLKPYAAGEWKVTEEEEACFAVMTKPGLIMGYAFFLYTSDQRGSVDVEILYAISASLENSMRAQMEASLHQALPWQVQAAAGKLASAKS
jgi:hypothetical protein